MERKDLIFAIAILSALTLERAARADLSAADQALADAWFERGYAAGLAHHYAEAREYFEKSYAIDPAAGVMLNIAACDKRLGHTATAWRELLKGAVEARKTGRQDWADDAERQAERIEPTLPRLILHLEPARDGDDRRVMLDGILFPDGMSDAPLPVDPGTHRVAAEAPGKRPWATAFDAKEGAVSLVTVPVLESEVAIPLVVRPHEQLAAPHPQPNDRPSWELGLGVVGGISALAAGALTVSAYATYQGAGCTTLCTSAGRAAQDRAWVQADVATVLGAAGAGALAGAALLWLLDPARTAHVEVEPIVGPTALGVSLERVW